MAVMKPVMAALHKLNHTVASAAAASSSLPSWPTKARSMRGRVFWKISESIIG